MTPLKICSFLGILTLIACQPPLERQPRTTPFSESDQFRDQSSARPLMKGTVPFFKSSDESPTLSAELLVEGRKNYEISCAVCHGFSGHGNGLVTQRGYPRPTDFSAPSECQLSNESLFQVISSGKDEMPPFAAKLNSHERWSVVHYVRALQLHDHFPARFLSVEERRRLEKSSR